MLKTIGLILIVIGIILLILMLILSRLNNILGVRKEYRVIMNSGHVFTHTAKEKRAGAYEKEIRVDTPREPRKVSKEAQDILDEIMREEPESLPLEDDGSPIYENVPEAEEERTIPPGTEVLDSDIYEDFDDDEPVSGTEVLMDETLYDEAPISGTEVLTPAQGTEVLKEPQGTEVLKGSSVNIEAEATKPREKGTEVLVSRGTEVLDSYIGRELASDSEDERDEKGALERWGTEVLESRGTEVLM